MCSFAGSADTSPVADIDAEEQKLEELEQMLGLMSANKRQIREQEQEKEIDPLEKVNPFDVEHSVILASWKLFFEHFMNHLAHIHGKCRESFLFLGASNPSKPPPVLQVLIIVSCLLSLVCTCSVCL